MPGLRHRPGTDADEESAVRTEHEAGRLDVELVDPRQRSAREQRPQLPHAFLSFERIGIMRASGVPYRRRELRRLEVDIGTVVAAAIALAAQ
jgi:hypothetical protein